MARSKKRLVDLLAALDEENWLVSDDSQRRNRYIALLHGRFVVALYENERVRAIWDLGDAEIDGAELLSTHWRSVALDADTRGKMTAYPDG
jgi:hypothetical protein